MGEGLVTLFNNLRHAFFFFFFPGLYFTADWVCGSPMWEHCSHYGLSFCLTVRTPKYLLNRRKEALCVKVYLIKTQHLHFTLSIVKSDSIAEMFLILRMFFTTILIFLDKNKQKSNYRKQYYAHYFLCLLHIQFLMSVSSLRISRNMQEISKGKVAEQENRKKKIGEGHEP